MGTIRTATGTGADLPHSGANSSGPEDQAQRDASGKGHAPHVLPFSTYAATWGALVALTAITVAASYVNWGPWNLAIALVIATTKALAVAAIFMHLWFDNKFHSVIFGSALVFLAIFIGFTMIDTETRGQADAAAADRPVDISSPFRETQSQARLRATYASPTLQQANPAASAASGPDRDPLPERGPLPAGAPLPAGPSSAKPEP